MADTDLFVLNGLHPNRYGDMELDGRPLTSIVLERIRKVFPDLVVLVPVGGNLPAVPCLEVADQDVYGAFSRLLEEHPQFEQYIFGDLYAPFLQAELGRSLTALNREAIAHYSYGEHYPRGVAPQVLSREALQILRGVASGNNRPLDDEAIFDLMGININAYDIEIQVSPLDFRQLRLDLRGRSFMAAALLRNLAGAVDGPLVDVDYQCLSQLLLSRPELLRTVPAYLELDLSENCDLACNFCPREVMGLSGKQDGPFMPVERALSLVEQLATLNPEAVLALSPYSEPLLYPHLDQVLAKAGELGLKLVLETNGTHLDDAMLDLLAACPEQGLIVIVSLDVLEPGEYAVYKGQDLFVKVKTGIERLLQRRQRDVYVQVLNMEELTDTVDAFYEFWQEHRQRVLPRKYNSFCGKLPNKNAVDLSPLRRFPCWHLKRDLVVRSDGRVGLCKQDLDLEFGAGNVFDEGLFAVWERLQQSFQRHLQQEDGGFPLCVRCDEWHTFNF